MQSYTDLIKALRHCIDPDTACDGCPLSGNNGLCADMLYRDAAAAIEDLQALYRQMDKRNTDLHNEGYDVGYWAGKRDAEAAQPHWVSVEQPPKDKQECFVAFKGPLGFVYDTGRFYDDLNSGLDEDIFEDGTSGFVLGGEVGYALGSIDYWMPIEPPQEDA